MKLNLIAIITIASFFILSCKKQGNFTTPQEQTNNFSLPEKKPNPLSLAHAREVIRKYKITKNNFKGISIEATMSLSTNSTEELYTIPRESQSLYITYNHNNIDPETLQILQNDNLAHVFNFPFANGETYDSNGSLNENTAHYYQNGNIYAYIPVTDNNVNTYVNNIHPTIIDTLYQPVNDQDPVYLYSLVNAGYISISEAQSLMQEQISQNNAYTNHTSGETETNIFGSLFKRPRGFVRYTDTELGPNQPVMGSRVYTLVFGIPIFTHTNNNGYFEIPWRFLVGTVVITQARNNNVTVMPLNLGFLVGSIHVHGWVGRGSLENISINYTQHNQARYWAHILNGVSRYRTFCSQNGMSPGPTHLTVWARWRNTNGSAAAPLLNHISVNSAILEVLANLLLNDDIDLAFELPNLSGLMGIRILPDMILSANKNENSYFSNTANRNVFSSSLSQVIFHEMGHASHFIKAGHSFYLGLMTNTFFTSIFNSNSGYGTYGSWWSENVQIAESWAEFIGDRCSVQFYPNGWKNGNGAFQRTITFMETDRHFVNNWIPYGILNDLQDGNINVTPVINFNEPWDIVSGATTNEIYNTLGPTIRGMADFRERFLQLYPRFNNVDVQNIYTNHQ